MRWSTSLAMSFLSEFDLFFLTHPRAPCLSPVYSISTANNGGGMPWSLGGGADNDYPRGWRWMPSAER